MVEKMKFISIIGAKEEIDRVADQILGKYEIQLENTLVELKELKNITPCVENNPYREPRARAAELAELLYRERGSAAASKRKGAVKTSKESGAAGAEDAFGKEGTRPEEKLSAEQAAALINGLWEAYEKSLDGRQELEKEIKRTQELLRNIDPFRNLHYDVASILHFQNIRFRFGRFPVENYQKFQDYLADDVCSIFDECRRDAEYVWGVYFVPVSEAQKVDAVYSSMHFERMYIDDDYEGTVEEAYEKLQQTLGEQKEKRRAADADFLEKLEAQENAFLKARGLIEEKAAFFEVRRLAAFTKHKETTFFILCGWMRAADAQRLTREMDEEPDLFFTVEDAAASGGNGLVHQKAVLRETAPGTAGSGEKKAAQEAVGSGETSPSYRTNPEGRFSKPPTSLKNPKLFKPFEMFIRMYGLPNYQEFDPTIFVALTYSVIFGAMFGDVGQGLCLFIGGLLLYHFKKWNLAAIVGSCGIFSTIFGFCFGSVFGFENVIEPLWLRPSEAITTLPFIGNLNTVFVISVALGMGFILLTMAFHIINCLRTGNMAEALFDTNGVAGLVFYGAVAAVVVLFMTGRALPGAAVLIVMFVLPLLVIACKEPLTALLLKKEKLVEGGPVMFVVQTFFELFEVLLSYFSNTLSFVRIGAFAVSHAAMMQVVMMLAGAENGGTPNILVVVIGNLIVCGMEGLIVGIQGLRLQYYEFFSRYYKGDGREFKPYRNSCVQNR